MVRGWKKFPKISKQGGRLLDTKDHINILNLVVIFMLI